MQQLSYEVMTGAPARISTELLAPHYHLRHAIHLTRRSIGMHSVGASLAQLLAQVLWSSHFARARAAAACRAVRCATPAGDYC